jgi:hypothetical protein
VAIDGLRRGADRVVGEISYAYASWAVRDCPGHWLLEGDPHTGSLTWVEGKLRPEDAIFVDFMRSIERHRSKEMGARDPRADSRLLPAYDARET